MIRQIVETLRGALTRVLPSSRRALATAFAVLWFIVFFTAERAQAHDIQPAVLALKEVAAGQFVVRWVPPNNGHGPGPAVTVQFPEQCALGIPAEVPAQAGAVTLSSLAASTWILKCTGAGLTGQVAFASPGNLVGPVGVNIDWLAGDDWFRITAEEPPVLDLPGAQRTNSWLIAAGDFVWLGVMHICGGPDHVLFVLGLLLLVRTGKRLLGTITAFTLAHSVTLTAATLGWVRVPTGPVEICIALSILLLAVETAQNTDTLTRRAPWLVAFSFGLLHGFGFASALSTTEIPSNRLPLSLLSFNVGVELGQLSLIGLSAVLWIKLPASFRKERRVERVVSCLLGAAATFWLLQRVQLWLQGLL